jgi:hypothetical protein
VTNTNEPALEDDATAKLFDAIAQRVRGGAYGPLLVIPMAGAVVWFWSVTPVFGVVTTLVSLAMVWQTVRQTVSGASRWPAAARRLLADEPWQETKATVLDTRGTVLALASGEYVRVYGLPAPAREVAVRAGRVWTVGPDAEGWLAVRVDGLHTPWPAKRIRARNAAPAVPTAGPVVAGWVDHLLGRARADLWYVLATSAGLVLLTMIAVPGWLVALVAAGAAAGVAAAVWQVRRVTRLRTAGPWRRADATVSSWTNRLQGRADGTIALRFPDGHRYTAHLEGVPIDLLANAWREEALWVAGNGVVGFLDYPVVAFAQLTPQE